MAAIALIGPLAWELPYAAVGVALKKKKKKKAKEKNSIDLSISQLYCEDVKTELERVLCKYLNTIQISHD